MHYLHRLERSNYDWCDLRVWPLSLGSAVLMKSDICFLQGCSTLIYSMYYLYTTGELGKDNHEKVSWNKKSL